MLKTSFITTTMMMNFFICSSGSRVVELLHHHPNVKGLNPADDTDTKREKCKKIFCLENA